MATPPDETVVARHLGSLRNLLPRGLLWGRQEGADLDRMLSGLATEFAELEDRAHDLHGEMDPNTTAEMLPDWERVAGLPDPCLTTVPKDSTDRRAALVAKLKFLGGQSVGFYVGLARTLGYTVRLQEYRDFHAGPGSGDPMLDGAAAHAGGELTNGDWIHVVDVHGSGEETRDFTAGSKAGDPLRTWGNENLICAFAFAKPAHTIFRYFAEWCLVNEDMLQQELGAWTLTAEATQPVVVPDGPIQAHGRAWLCGTTLTANLPSFYACNCGVFEPDGDEQYLYGYFRLTGTGDPAPRFRLSIFHTTTQLSSVLCQWQPDGSLQKNQGDGAVHDMGAGWWRVRVDFISNDQVEGNGRTCVVQVTESAPFHNKTLEFAPGYFTKHLLD